MAKELVSENGGCLQIRVTKSFGDLSLTIEQLVNDLTIQAQLICELVDVWTHLLSKDLYVLKDSNNLYIAPKNT